MVMKHCMNCILGANLFRNKTTCDKQQTEDTNEKNGMLTNVKTDPRFINTHDQLRIAAKIFKFRSENGTLFATAAVSAWPLLGGSGTLGRPVFARHFGRHPAILTKTKEYHLENIWKMILAKYSTSRK